MSSLAILILKAADFGLAFGYSLKQEKMSSRQPGSSFFFYTFCYSSMISISASLNVNYF